MAAKRTFRLSYCDACRPVYDRFDVAAYLRKETEGLIEFTEDQSAGEIIIMGCDAALCADARAAEGKALFIRGRKGVDELRDLLRKEVSDS